MAIRVSPKTRLKLEKMRDVTGNAYGVLVDQMVNDYPLVDDYYDLPYKKEDKV